LLNPGQDWTEGELLDLFRFQAEDSYSEDPDVLYRGELINVERGGIRHYTAEPRSNLMVREPTNITEIQGSPYTVNPAEIKKLF